MPGQVQWMLSQVYLRLSQAQLMPTQAYSVLTQVRLRSWRFVALRGGSLVFVRVRGCSRRFADVRCGSPISHTSVCKLCSSRIHDAQDRPASASWRRRKARRTAKPAHLNENIKSTLKPGRRQDPVAFRPAPLRPTPLRPTTAPDRAPARSAPGQRQSTAAGRRSPADPRRSGFRTVRARPARKTSRRS